MSNFQLRELFDNQLQKIARIIRENNSVIDTYEGISINQIGKLNLIEIALFNALTTENSEAPNLLLCLRDASGLPLRNATKVFSEYNDKITEFEKKLENLGSLEMLEMALIKAKGDLIEVDKEKERLSSMFIADRDAYFIAQEIKELASKDKITLAENSSWVGRLLSPQKKEIHEKIIHLGESINSKYGAQSFVEGDDYCKVIDEAKNTEYSLASIQKRIVILQGSIAEVTEFIQRHNRLSSEIYGFKPLKFAQKVFNAAINEIDSENLWKGVYQQAGLSDSLENAVNTKAKIAVSNEILNQLKAIKYSLRTMTDDLERNEQRLRDSSVSHRVVSESNFEKEIQRVLAKMSKSIKWASHISDTLMSTNIEHEHPHPVELFKLSLLSDRDTDSSGGLSLLGKGLIDNKKLSNEFKSEITSIFSRNGIYNMDDIKQPYLHKMESFEVPVIIKSEPHECDNKLKGSLSNIVSHSMGDDSSSSSRSNISIGVAMDE